MAIEIKVPELGESVVEATIGTWRKKQGDAVAAGDVLVELETDKVDLEVEAEQAGVISQLLFEEGADVEVGQVIALLDPDGAADAGDNGQAEPASGSAATANRQEVSASSSEGTANRQEVSASSSAGTRIGHAVSATPVARRMAAEAGVDLAAVRGTGPQGRVTKDDVEAATRRSAPAPQPAAPAAPAAPAPEADPRGEVREKMSRRRRTIARRLVEAQQTAAMLTTFNEVDMSRVMELRRRRKQSFQERTGESLSISAFFVKAVVGALKAFPRLNAEIQGEEMVLKQYYDIGMAIGAEEGLVVPVLRDADRMSFADISRAIKTYARQATEGTLSLADLRGGSFTITNGGVFGSMLSTPILNPPQVGILGMHNIVNRPVAVDGEVVVRPIMYLALSYDHRIVDGREAVQFLVRVKELVEDPESLLLEG